VVVPYYRAVCDTCGHEWQIIGSEAGLDGMRHYQVSGYESLVSACPGTLHVDAEPTIEEES
jgi:hypothetical protein